ncbi:hypothetical protein DRJ17_04385 [Candidatus Woesearchaeota archaeon]|nr:MAG: hypothetical protein DRJ17_04385 [Candidatus Woesearchaeota archaeon]
MKETTQNVQRFEFMLFLLVWLFLCVFRLIVFDINKNNYFWDEVVYLALGKNILLGIYGMGIGEAFRPPLLPFFISIFQNTVIVHFILVLIGIGASVIIYLFAKKLYKNKIAGFVAANLLLSSGLILYWNLKILTDILALFFVLISIYLFYLWIEKDKNSLLYSSMLFSALGVLTRYTLIILPVSFLIYILLKERFRILNKKYAIGFFIFLLTVSPIFILGIINYNHPFGMLFENLHVLKTAQTSNWYYVINIYEVTGITIFLFLIGLLKIKKRFLDVKRTEYILYLFLILFFLGISVIREKQTRFLIPALPIFFIIASKGYLKLSKLMKRYRFFLHLVLVTIMVSITFNNYFMIKEKSYATETLLHASKFLRGLDGKRVLCNSEPYCEFFGAMEVNNFTYTQEEFVKQIEEFKPDFLFVDNYHRYVEFEDFIIEKYPWIYYNTSKYGTIRIYAVNQR